MRWLLKSGWETVMALTVAIVVVGAASLLLVALASQIDQSLPVPACTTVDNQSATITADADLGSLGVYSKWSEVQIAFTGPDSAGSSGSPNPFLVDMSVTFTGPGGIKYVAPAFYDGDGSGGLDGNVWRVRFSPDAVGTWSFTSSSCEPLLDGYTGTFDVSAPAACDPLLPNGLPDFSCVGRLEYVGGHHLKFVDGEYWIKAGIDDPENFLGTPFGDWNGKKAAIDYLASKGVNSVYIMTNTIAPGDGNDTWPWLGDTPNEAKSNSDRFNVSKLQKWEDFFNHVQDKGIVLHIVLDDDSAWHGYDHDLYYREMIARFGHHPALIWNVGEEANENYSNSEQIALASTIKGLDPYDHPVTVHRRPTWPFLGDPNFDLTSIQPGDGASDFTTATLGDYNQIVINHRDASVAKGRPIPIMIDETPQVKLVNSSTRLKMRSGVLYPIFLAGGNFELHYSTSELGGTLTVHDLEPMLEDMRRAREFVESLPFDEMSPCNSLVSAGGSGGYCYGKLDEVLAIYLPLSGVVDVDLSSFVGPVGVQWFDPKTGNCPVQPSVMGGGIRTLTAPFAGDALLRLSAGSASGATTSLSSAGSSVFVPVIITSC
jgi:hypothetical protein